MNQAIWPAEPGGYALVIEIPSDCTLVVGRLGLVTVPSGRYIYLGSAQGAGGLQGRLARHMRLDRRRRWHIDYLTERAPVCEVYFKTSPQRLECRWTRALLSLNGATAPIPGFGNGDCRERCPAHLIRLPEGFGLDRLDEVLRSA